MRSRAIPEKKGKQDKCYENKDKQNLNHQMLAISDESSFQYFFLFLRASTVCVTRIFHPVTLSHSHVVTREFLLLIIFLITKKNECLLFHFENSWPNEIPSSVGIKYVINIIDWKPNNYSIESDHDVKFFENKKNNKSQEKSTSCVRSGWKSVERSRERTCQGSRLRIRSFI